MRRVKPPAPPTTPGVPSGPVARVPGGAPPRADQAFPAKGHAAPVDEDTGLRRRRAAKGLGTEAGAAIGGPASRDASRVGATSVGARLQAMGFDAKRAEPKVLTGKIVVESAADLEQLRGVTTIKGDLAIQETAKLSAGACEVLRGLVEVEGRLTLEGNAALTAVDFLSSLERVGSTVYLGFNDAVESVALPKLAHVGGALIVEANARLEKLSLPALTTVARYLDVHENPRLVEIEAPRLQDAQRLSFVDNRRLVKARVGAPVKADVELADNGVARLVGLAIAS